jgi:hypothetical protein
VSPSATKIQDHLSTPGNRPIRSSKAASIPITGWVSEKVGLLQGILCSDSRNSVYAKLVDYNWRSHLLAGQASPKICNRFRQSLAIQTVEVLGDALGRVLQAHAMVLCSLHDQPRCETQEIKDEIVRMLGLDTELSERFRRKIGKITSDDNAGAAVDRSGEDMTVLRVRRKRTPFPL